MRMGSQKMWRLAGRYSSLGIEMTVAVALGVFGGRWLDGQFGTEPFLFWFGLVVGIGAATRGVVRAVKMTRLSDL